MRLVLAIACASALLTSPVLASSSQDTMKACAAAWKAMPAADQGKTTYKQFSAACLKAGGPDKMATAAPARVPTPQEKMTACAAKWQAEKTAGTTGGETYQHFTAECLKAA